MILDQKADLVFNMASKQKQAFGRLPLRVIKPKKEVNK